MIRSPGRPSDHFSLLLLNGGSCNAWVIKQCIIFQCIPKQNAWQKGAGSKWVMLLNNRGFMPCLIMCLQTIATSMFCPLKGKNLVTLSRFTFTGIAYLRPDNVRLTHRDSVKVTNLLHDIRKKLLMMLEEKNRTLARISILFTLKIVCLQLCTLRLKFHMCNKNNSRRPLCFCCP